MDPYRPPQSDMQLAQKGTPVGDDPFHGASWEIGTLITATMDKIKAQAGPFMILAVGYGGVVMFFSILNQLITAAGQGGGMDPNVFLAISGVMSLISGVVQFLLGLVVMMGILRIARNQSFTPADLMPSGKVVITVIGAGILVGLMQMLGMILFFIPFLIVFYATFFHKWLIVDQEMGAIDAITESFRMTDGHKMALFVWTLALFGVGLVAFVLTCGLGVFLLLPFAQIANVLIYDNIRRQRGLID